MEEKYFIFSTLTIFLCFGIISVKTDDSESIQNLAIYIGDTDAFVGEPFTISCIIPVTEPINWLKNGKSIVRHNLRHGKDDHAYIAVESPIDEYTGSPSIKTKTHLTTSSLSNYEATDRIRTIESTRGIPEISHTDSTTKKPQKKKDDILVPNYDLPDKQIKTFELRKQLVLSCNVTHGDDELKWEKNGTDITNIKGLEGRYKILKDERKLIIEKTIDKDDGLYSCVYKGEKKDFNVYAKIEVRTPSNAGVVEGEKLTITCAVVGTDPELEWKHGNKSYNASAERFILKDDEVSKVKNAIFIIENASLEDRGEYKCVGKNAASTFTDVTMVRVKGKMAALWPFLGICAEVFVLCAIILIYEKRRNKAEMEESDTDQNNDQKKKRRNYE